MPRPLGNVGRTGALQAAVGRLDILIRVLQTGFGPHWSLRMASSKKKTARTVRRTASRAGERTGVTGGEGQGGRFGHRRRAARQVSHRTSSKARSTAVPVSATWCSAGTMMDSATTTPCSRLASRISDAMVRLDPATMRNVPWDNNIFFFLGDFVTAGGGHIRSARARH